MHIRRAALAASLLFVVGCGSSNDSYVASGGTSSPSQATTAANLFIQGPPVTGQVTALDASGRTVATAPAVAGVASLSVPASSLGDVRAQGDSPLTIRFIVDDPLHLDAGDGDATFSAEVPAVVDGDVVGIDAVSSLIALYHDSHPEMTFEEAAAEVFEYLDLPEDTNPEHLFTDTDFESSLFYSEARANGGVDLLLEQVTAEIDLAGNAEPGRFLQANLADAVNLNGIATSLARSALDFNLGALQGELKDQLVGWLQGVVGISGPPGIGDVLNAIEGLRQDIERLGTQIERLQNISAYKALDNILATQRSDALVDTERLLLWASPTNRVPPSEAQIAANMSAIRQRYNSTLTSAANLELPRVGATGASEPGLVGLYLDGTVPRLYGAHNKDKATFHLRRSLNFQQTVLNLMVEALHYERPSLLLDAEVAIDTYFANFKSQQQQYPLPFDEDNILLDRGTKLLWTRRPLIVDDGREIARLIAGYTLGDAPRGSWRLPSPGELATLVSATGGTGIDQHTEIGMLREGFLPVNGASTIGDWRIGELNWLVLTNDFRADNVSAGGTMVHVSNFRQSRNSVVDYDRHSGVSTPHRVAFYLVRSAPEIESIAVSEKSRTATSVSFVATARMSDGSSRDVTELVRWGAQTSSRGNVGPDVARISNVAGTDGVLTYRTSDGNPITVVATHNSVEGRLQAPRLAFQAPALTSILISPVRYQVASDGYVNNSVEIAFTARTARANGALANAGTEVTWTSSDPAVATVSNSGLVRAIRPGSIKVVDITATIGGRSQTSKLVLNP